MAKIFLSEEQCDRLFINEEDNPAYKRSNANATNLKMIWAAIDEKQRNLQKIVFGNLNDKLLDIASEKLKQMGDKYAEIPKTICNAGNKKLPASVLIINMSSSLMCPSYYLGICLIKNGACYAQNDENRHVNNVLPQRWKTDIMHTQMLQQYQQGDKTPIKEYFRLIETYIQLGNAYCENIYRDTITKMEMRLKRKLTDSEKELFRVQSSDYKITDVRLNETGDFQCQLAVDLWDKFAGKIKKKYGISTHAYTARKLDFSKTKNIAINASRNDINIGEEKIRQFKAVDDNVYNRYTGGTETINRQPVLGVTNNGKYYYKCPCTSEESKCGQCGVCFEKNKTGKEYTIFVKYHGVINANGLKGLFTKNEINNVIEKMYQNNWITPEEYQKYKSNNQQKKLSNISKKIYSKRKTSKK